MPVPDYKNDKETETYRNDLNDWIIPCRDCLKAISSSRPPVFNSDNCSCSELGEHASGTSTVVPPVIQTRDTNNPALEDPVHEHLRPSPTYVSASTQTTADYVHHNGNMTSAADAGSRHTKNNASSTQPRTYTTRHAYPLDTYLNEPENSLYTFAPQTGHGRKRSSSMRARKGSNRGQSSLRSSGSADSAAEPRFPGWEIDLFMGLGTWDSASGEGADDSPKYALTMSGLSEAVRK
jgi:hypothetical protein